MPGQPVAPVEYLPQDLGSDGKPSEALATGIGLCLSGGGYRAMLFHLGAVWRLQELGLLNATETAPCFAALGPLSRISSVSGGSITSAALGIRWMACRTADPSPPSRVAAFLTQVVEPIRAMAKVTLAGRDAKGVLKLVGAIVGRGTVNDYIAKNYARHLYGDATLQSLPDSPRFVINASNLQSGSLWRFSKPYMWDWRVGKIPNSTFSLARAVAASSAFPPVLSPAILEFPSSSFVAGSGGRGRNDLQRSPYTTRVELTDGGVYDNLGLETVWKSYGTVLVSNAGKPFDFQESVGINWLSQSERVIDLMDNQVGSLRKRMVVDSFVRKQRNGAYWGIESDIANYPCANKLPCPLPRTTELANVPTDLERKDDDVQERLVNWGYAICDAAVRSWVEPSFREPEGFPYARGV